MTGESRRQRGVAVASAALMVVAAVGLGAQRTRAATALTSFRTTPASVSVGASGFAMVASTAVAPAEPTTVPPLPSVTTPTTVRPPLPTIPRTTVPLVTTSSSTTTTAPPGPVSAADTPGMYVINIDGSGLRRIAGTAGYPSWSPTGDRVAYNTADGIVVATVSGTSRVVANGAQLTRGGPSWDPTGTLLAYPAHSATQGERDIFVVD